MSIGETNVRGTVRDRITFFKWVLEQCAASGIERVSWWGLTDAVLWGNGNLTRFWRTQRPDPVGIYTLDDNAKHGSLWTRQSNEFSEIVKAYGNGLLSIEDIPTYEFSGELKTVLDGYAKNHMKHWQKREKVYTQAA